MRTHVEKEGDEANLQLPVLTTPGFILCRNSSLYTEVAMAPTTPTSLCSLVHCKSLESIGEKNPETLAFLLQWFLLAICSKIVGESFRDSAPDLKLPTYAAVCAFRCDENTDSRFPVDISPATFDDALPKRMIIAVPNKAQIDV
jgi:hypothetical protein